MSTTRDLALALVATSPILSTKDRTALISINRAQTVERFRCAVRNLEVDTVKGLVGIQGIVDMVSSAELSHIHLTYEQELKRLQIAEILFQHGLKPRIALEACIFSDVDLFGRYMCEWFDTATQDEFIEAAHIILSRIGFLAADYPIHEAVINLVMEALQTRGYDNDQHYWVVFGNAAYFANAKVFKVFIERGFEPDENLVNRIAGAIKFYQEKGSTLRVQRYRELLSILVARKVAETYEAVLRMIREHDFELNRGGIKVSELNGAVISKGAAKVYVELKNALNDRRTLVSSFPKMREFISQALGASAGGWGWGYGDRSTSTTALYTQIITLMSKTVRYYNMLSIDENAEFEFKM